MSEPRPDRIVDARGQRCPMPIVELARALRALPAGGVVLLLATDPALEADLRAFCGATGHQLLSLHRAAPLFRAFVRRGG